MNEVHYELYTLLHFIYCNGGSFHLNNTKWMAKHDGISYESEIFSASTFRQAYVYLLQNYINHHSFYCKKCTKLIGSVPFYLMQKYRAEFERMNTLCLTCDSQEKIS